MNYTEFILYENESAEIDLNLTRTTLFWPSRGSWPMVNKQIKWWLLLHSYGFALSFLILGFYSFFSVLNIRSLMTNRPFMSSINIFLCSLSASRAILLFIDPYALKDIMPKLLSFTIWDIGLPSLISAVAFLQMALLHLTQIPVRPNIFKNKSCISLVISLHFGSVLAIDILMGLYTKTQMFKYILESLFNLWGMILSGLFLHTSLKALRLLNGMPSAALEREIDAQFKGIMQLAMLAPYNNLATSVAAALMPTILTPKLIPKATIQSTPTKGSDAMISGGDSRNKDTVKTCPSISSSTLSSSTSKGEPKKSCMLKTTPKPSPSSSDGEDSRSVSEGGKKRPKKLSWGPERRLSGHGPKRAVKTEEKPVETEEADASLLPEGNKSENDLTLDAIMNHIAYMNRGGVSETTLSRKQRLKGVLKLMAVTPVLVFILISASFLRMLAPKAWYIDYRSWLAYETFCRFLEITIGWSMANLTKQPVSNRKNGYTGHVSSKQSMFM